jgi:hypothetical protein
MRNRGIDIQRISAAVERPGIDPRVWCSLAIVTDFHVDPEVGPLADIELIPDETPHTARLGTVYSGSGFGFYAPVAVDDEVLVVAPSGHPDNGLVIVARMHSASDPPPEQAEANPQDVLLHVKADNDLRLVVTGEGTVRIGSPDAAEPLVLGTQLKNLLSTVLGALTTHTHSTGVGPSGPPLPPELATFNTEKGKVDAGDLNSDVAFTTKTV